MTANVDLDAYFRRIGYDGPRTPTLQTLQALHRLQPLALPFENLDPWIGKVPDLEVEALQAKMIAGRRGGYCFEMNGLFQAVLEALGFRLTSLIGRVVWNRPDGLPTPNRSHMGLRVELPEGVFLADAAFGGNTMTAAVRLEPELEQDTPHGKVRLIPDAHGYAVEHLLAPGDWRPAYLLGLEPQVPADFETANWWTATHPSSIFVNNLVITAVKPDGRVMLVNRTLTRRPLEGAPETERLETARDMARALDEVFEITPPAPVESFFDRTPV